MPHQTTKQDDHLYLVSIICGIMAVLAVVVYWLWGTPSHRLGQLLIAFIPSALVGLIAMPLAYFVFVRKGIHFSPRTQEAPSIATPIDYGKIKDTMTEALDEHTPFSNLPSLFSAYETYREIDWSWLLAQGRERVDIVVYYFDSWVKGNPEALREYFRKPNTKMRIFVADPRKEDILDNVHRLFPDYGRNEVSEKIARTGTRVRDVLKEAGASQDRFEFYYVPHVLNYSAQCIDGRILVLSLFEMFRQNKIDSPAFLFDLSKSEHLSNYWEKELEGLLEVSERMDVDG